MKYDTIIIGGGTAGLACALYSARFNLKTLLIAKEFGGTGNIAHLVDNWIGEPEVIGLDLMQKFIDHVKKYKVPMVEGEHPYIPNTTYGASKAAGELITKAYRKQFGMNTTIVASLTRNHDAAPFSVHPLRPYKNGFINDGPLVRSFIAQIKENPHLLTAHLFPDSVTFCHHLRLWTYDATPNTISLTEEGIAYTYEASQASWINEVMTAHMYLLLTVPLIGPLRPLPDEDVAYILGMDAEKYRQHRMTMQEQSF